MIFCKKIEEMYRARLFTRYDDTGLVRYFSHEDFEGLMAKPYEFKSSLGHALKGYFYAYEGARADRLIVFEHGMGGGHRSYMKEIERLCSLGYRVFAYDHTGCMESGGENTGGFGQSLCDLDDCLNALKEDADVFTDDITVMGHSWGGFSTLNIAALHPDVKRIVVLSGFLSVERMVSQTFSGILSLWRGDIMALERAENGRYAEYDALDTLKSSSVRALLIYSDNDPLVKKKHHYDVLKSELEGRADTELVLVHGRGHNPNYTDDAVAYLSTLAPEMKRRKPSTKEERRAFCGSFDWHRMTAQDDAVWNKIRDFLT